MADTIVRTNELHNRTDRKVWFEAAWLIGGLAVFFLVNVLTVERSPTVWCDEVMYQDPAVNLYQGHGFTSGAWFLQTRDKFWAGNVPLYQCVLYVWLKVFGFSITTVRCLHYALVSTAILVAWLAIKRLNLIQSPAHRLLFCLVVSLCTATTFVYRCARPDTLGILLVAVTLLSFSFRIRWISLLMLVFSGILLIGSGMQLAAYAAAMTGLVLILGPRRLLPEMAALCAGCAIGACLGWLLYVHQGVWKDFVDSVGHHTIANNGIQYSVVRNYGNGFFDKVKQVPGLFEDYSFVPLFAFAVLMGWGFMRSGCLRRSSPLIFGVVACVLVPLALHTVGVFPIYYFWMAFFPLTLGIFAELARWQGLQRRMLKGLSLIVCVGLACAVGLPRRLIVASLEWSARDYDPVMKLAEPYVAHDKLVVCDFAAYYAAKQHGAEVVLPTYLSLLSAQDKAKISTAILRNRDVASLARQFGGTWQDSGKELNPPLPSSYFRENLDSRQYHLHVYLRRPEEVK